ncbi:MAG: hypothetical protein H7832_05505 [Magnetococcus sp. DMHC-6]
MKPEEWIGVIAVLFLLGVAVAALVPDYVWNPQRYDSTARMAGSQTGTLPAMAQRDLSWASPAANATLPANQVPTVTPNSTPKTMNQMNRMPIANDAIPHVPNIPTKPQPGIIAFEQAPRERFDGTIQQISEMPERDGQIHIWVSDNTGQEKQISLAPNWFLKYMGCILTHDIPISGIGFRFDQNKGDALIYARKISVNGRNCILRNDEGFALWSNKLR